MTVVEVRPESPEASAQQLAPSLEGIFPLPLTAFETLMFLDARPDYPMWADIEVQFQGRIDRAAFEAGLAFALPRNPLLTSLVAPAGKHAWQWVPSDQQPAIDWAPLGTPLGPTFGEYVDLTKTIGLKLWVRESDQRSTVLIDFHHACSDGIGLYGFIEDLMVGYNAAIAGSAPVTPRPLEPAKLLQRGLLQVPVRSPLQQVHDLIVSVREGLRFYWEAPLTLPAQEQPAEGSRVPFITRTLPPEVSEGLRFAAARAGAMRNDLLIRDLMLTLRQWPAPDRGPSRWRNLRICMPQNLRDRYGARIPACNAISFAFITRRTARCAAPEELLASIAAETALVRRWKLSLYFLGGLATLQSRGLLSWLLRRRVCFSTVVLSNLGDPTRYFQADFPRTAEGLSIGNLVFRGIIGSPPVRPLTRATIGVAAHGETLAVTLRCDPRCYSPLDAERLLDDYVSQLRATAAQCAAAGSAQVAEP